MSLSSVVPLLLLPLPASITSGHPSASLRSLPVVFFLFLVQLITEKNHTLQVSQNFHLQHMSLRHGLFRQNVRTSINFL